MVNQKYVSKVMDLLLSADTVEDFDQVIKILVLEHGVPILRNMIEVREKNKICHVKDLKQFIIGQVN